MAKRYKPGQFVSIGGKLCRVKCCISPWYTCSMCEISDDCGEKLSTECRHKLGNFNYPEPIKPKRQG